MIFKRILVICALIAGSSVKVPAQQITLTETSEGINFLCDGRLVLTYRTSVAEVPEGIDPAFGKSGFIHPLLSPSGQELTRIHPPDHYHHYGIWGPWTRTTIANREVDFWNLGDGTGRVDFERVLSRQENPSFAELVVRQIHTDLKAPDGPQAALEEDLGIRVWTKAEDRYTIDYTTTISTPLSVSVMLEAYRYGGGIGFRATGQWNPENSTMLTSEGLSREEADGSSAKWLIVQGESDAEQGLSGIVFLSHPANRSHPEPLRVWPEDSNGGEENVFLDFSPTRNKAWEIEPGKTYTLRYRLIVYDGALSAREAEQYWEAFAADLN